MYSSEILNRRTSSSKRQSGIAGVVTALQTGQCEVREKTRYWELKENAPDHTLVNSLWKAQWTCHTTDYRMNDERHEIFPSPDSTFINVKPSN